MIKSIEKIGAQWQTKDPFLFCAYHHDYFPKGNQSLGPDADLSGRNLGSDFNPAEKWRMYHGDKIPGFPAHPHRGFETVTIVTKGFIDHSDSLGSSGRFANGDVQWMTAGKGVQHSEMFPLLNTHSENELELFQIWLNLPMNNKKQEPEYKMLWAEDIPEVNIGKTGKSILKLIAGNFNGKKALDPTRASYAAMEGTDLQIWLINLAVGDTIEIPEGLKASHRSLYFYEGEKIFVNDKNVEASHRIEMADARAVMVKNESSQLAKILVLQAVPMNEPVYQHGPFVGVNKRDIMDAFSDFQNGKFGDWEWSEPGPVHGSEKKRFAIYADGRKEMRQ